jgi:alginate O-acetyltransferase complex protein AlgI
MLFTTPFFTLLYLPVVLAGFFGLGHYSLRAAAAWLFAASLFFYASWMPAYTVLLLASIAFNYLLGARISRCVRLGDQPRAGRWTLAGVACNLAALAYFKYANFFLDNLNLAFGTAWDIGRVVLPLGISFFTFTQIAFLVDVCRKGVEERDWVHYGLFVTYFPHLVAGPVLHHGQMMPQFRDPASYRWRLDNFAAGLAIFLLGLFKKIVLADGISPFADAVFNAADAGELPTLQEAWLGAIAYTLQLYFDFSGYSDMAIGLSLMLNIRLPFNFNSPYRALNISDFWRRWHISLSSFLRDYLYIALGGNRRGNLRRYANLLATMVLGGLWHGASWSFVLWGALHGIYLVVHQAWRRLPGETADAVAARPLVRLACWGLTMLAVVLGWVLFRATTLDGVSGMLAALTGLAPSGPTDAILWNQGLQAQRGWLLCAVWSVVAVLPWNSNLIGEKLRSWILDGGGRPAFVLGSGSVLVLLAIVVNGTRGASGAFIYFNF